MQTFLPHPSFYQAMEDLDDKRLGNQRNEANIIIKILEGRNKSNAWVNHPAVRMWRGHVKALKLYYNCCVEEWIRRGFKNNMKLYNVCDHCGVTLPLWLGYQPFHESHRSNLIRKKPKYYKEKWPNTSSDLPYIWPVDKDGNLADEIGG